MIGQSFLNPKPLTRKDKLTFGKYENHTIKWVIENDPGYIVWISENLPFLPILKKIVDECQELFNISISIWDEDDFSYWEWWKD